MKCLHLQLVHRAKAPYNKPVFMHAPFSFAGEVCMDRHTSLHCSVFITAMCMCTKFKKRADPNCSSDQNQGMRVKILVTFIGVSCLYHARQRGIDCKQNHFQQPPHLGAREVCHAHKTQFQLPDGARTAEIASSKLGSGSSPFVEIMIGAAAAALSCLAWISS